MFVHSVYFWLRDDLAAEDRANFDRGLHALLAIDTVIFGHIGVPAATDRPIIDRSYSYALVLEFADQQGHDQYQEHPAHQQFLAVFSQFWSRVLVYDSTTPESNPL